MKKILEFLKDWVFTILNLFSSIFAINLKPFLFVRTFILKITGISIEKNCFIDLGFRFLHPKNISIGNNVSLGHFNKIWAFNKVEIGNYVQTAIGLTIVSGGHETNDYSAKTINQEIIIEGENWIGANVTILGGVTIGKGTVVGAGSVVVKSLPAYSICVGNPCKVIRKRTPSKSVISPFGNYEPSYFNNEKPN
ncbi:acyltransferase [uncultured Polaribacter sp.]|uniref:acyltransferase n=1 Tax=uncultured Polaribacter sp. TaxID=174711 RepID=UPI00261AD663|nr:acyltransferase [uncultured Polaribacter sp.]